ncbi:receptor-like protein kinase FERONIA [Coffea arabica]|uniref:Receptor-like protein kinase FERONIA n=1 Tax=Coffea arabica TaxID=13443 RepID=A0A6P6SJF5_COFAR|nr:receptor-like protein kinase FERONIA [Coffea arabica]
MFTFLVYLCFLFNSLFVIASTDSTPSYTPTDYILINCGSSLNSTSVDGRKWDGDVGSKFSPNDMANISIAVTATELNSSVSEVPFSSARIIRSQFSYIFPVSLGRKFLRLYFHAVSYSSGLNPAESFFTVTANSHTLLSNFSPYLTVSTKGFSPASVVKKEYIINVQDMNQFLNVTFFPSSNSYAFLNGIEVVSTQDDIYMGNHDVYSNPLKFANVQFGFDQDKSAFETLYRLNVGGSVVSVVDDGGMFREWAPDDEFLWGADLGNPLSNNEIAIKYTPQTPNYTAPPVVYSTARAMGEFSTRFNLSWMFPVDSGFYYLIRLHFCEIDPDLITQDNQRVFKIFISNRTAELEADVIHWAGGPGIPIFRDYLLFVPKPPDSHWTKQDLFLALHPNLDVKPKYADAILNGLELFKLNTSDGSLGGTNPNLSRDPNSLASNKKSPIKGSPGKSRVLFAAIGGGAAGGVSLILILGFLIFRGQWKRRVKDLDQKSAPKSSLSTPPRSTKTGASGSSSLRRFLLEEIGSATANFDAKFVIGTGGFGNVYKGYIDNNLTTVAIKRLNPSSRQGAREFQTEIEMLSKLRHLHLVSLIGYCDEKSEMILVYDYMANGTLRDHLYRTDNPPLPWKQRLQICIGAAKGLDYLHTGTKHTIIHRDVKSTNILLDETWVAKVSDFGLSKLGPSGIYSHISTQVKGSFGYIDPEYYTRQQLTDKSDVYSFGVVLFEVLCGRAPIILDLPQEQVNLAEWAKKCYKKGIIHRVVDPDVKGEIAPQCLRIFAETANNCLKDQGIQRPGMDDVVGGLEFALQVQEAAENEGGRPDPFPLHMHGGDVQNMTDDDTDVISESEGDQDSAGKIEMVVLQLGHPRQAVTTSRCDSVFSEILNPTGR